MVKDYTFFSRRTDQADEDVENVPLNPPLNSSHPPPHLSSFDSSRAPLHSILEPTHNSKLDLGGGTSRGKLVDTKTPTKAKAKISDAPFPLRTPEKQGCNSTFGRNRFGWSTSKEARSEGKPDLPNHATQTHFTRNGGGGISVNSTPGVSRTTVMGRVNSGCSDSTSTQSTPNKSVSKPPNPGFASMSSSRPTGTAGGAPRAAVCGALSRRLLVTSNPTAVNTTEVPHFDLKEDPSFWMDHNVQVIIRVRPLNSLERSIHGYNRCVRQDSAQRITWIGQPEARFTFDHVACESMDQETLFRMAALPMVENCLSGYNSCMFAYGQTGSGKTYTMLGEIDDLQFKPSPNRGMTPRIFEFLFARIRAEEQTRRDEKLMYSCKCSFLEIYNEQVADLLDPSSTNLLLREDARKGVYVENLSEFEVHTVTDILKLLAEGSSNRRVAATNMNRESSRSHSVFTCIIESKWERDSTKNMRFACLNLVDLAGSERQKASGAEGERLKEAANINKSLSTLGHVIMALVDVAHGKPRHVPYRDSRLTFLLQDSLGGNSKTMIIANISPSICCAAETLNTLKFAQRAKLIQNNAVVNEDSSANVTALQLQIRLLQEELFALKHHNVSRSLSFGPAHLGDKMEEDEIISSKKEPDRDHLGCDPLLESMPHGASGVTYKQLKSVEAMLAGALRRERVAETSIKQLEAEIEQLNRLVHQREEDTRSTKMMLKFREDKIQRMEAFLGELKPVDAYLLDENNAMSEEIRLLRAKVDRNPEVTRFAIENIRLLDQLRKFQDFYEEGERDILVAELCELREQVIHILDGNIEHFNDLKMLKPAQEAADNSKGNDSLQLELDHSLNELAECRSELKSCLETNEKLSREIDSLHALLSNIKPVVASNHKRVEVIQESTVEVQPVKVPAFCTTETLKNEGAPQSLTKHAEDLVNLELELDIVKTILREERSSRGKLEDITSCLTRDLKLAEESALLIAKQYEVVKEELKDAKSIIQALESEQLLSISEMEDLRSDNTRYMELLRKQDLEICDLKDQICSQESTIRTNLKNSDCQDSPLQSKFNKMKASLDMAKRLNMWYQCDHANQISTQEEIDEIHRQAESETAEVIVCLQAELSTLELQVQDCEMKKKEGENRLVVLETELRELRDNLNVMKHDNEVLREELRRKEREVTSLSEDWEMLGNEIETALFNGHEALIDASNNVNSFSCYPPKERKQISDEVGRIIRLISEKDLLIGELSGYLEDAHKQKSDMECMLRSLKGATLVITESHQQDCAEKEKEILKLRSELNKKASDMNKLEKKIKLDDYQLKRTSSCAAAAFVIVNRLSEVNSSHLDALRRMDEQLREASEMNKLKDTSLCNQAGATEKLEEEVLRLRRELNENVSTIMDLENRIELHHDQIYRTSTCATVAFLVVNRLSELNSVHLDALNHIDCQLRETLKMNKEKDRFISEQAAVLKEADRRVQHLEEAEIELLRLRSELNAKSLTMRELEKRAKLDCDRLTRTCACATAAFLIVKRLAEVNSGHLDALRHIDVQLQESIEVNQLKDMSLIVQAAATEETARNIEALGKELKLSEDICCGLREQLAEQQKCLSIMQRRLEEQDENDIMKTKEKLVELKKGVLNIKSSMCGQNDQAMFNHHSQPSDSVDISHGESAENEADFHKVDHCSAVHFENEAHDYIDKNISVNVYEQKKSQTFENNCGKDVTIVLLRKEIESAIDSLNGVQAEVACLYAEKEKNAMSEKQARESTEALKVLALTLQRAFIDFEKQCGSKIINLNHKLLKVEESTQEAITCWCQRKELLKSELNDAKIVTAQKMAEASCFFKRFEEAQDIMKKADIMINGLMIANEKMKFEIEDLKSREATVKIEKECLANETQTLQKSYEFKEQQYNLLEKQFHSDSSEMRCLVKELEGFIPWMLQLSSKEKSVITTDDLYCIKSQFHRVTDLIWSWLEEIWCEIVLNECAASVLQLCHIGALLEVVNGLKGENRQLFLELTKSDSCVSDLREQNMKSNKQLEICTLVTGKILADMEKSFDLISRKEDEAGKLSAKLSIFEKQIIDLQLQEAFLLERSDHMGNKLGVLVKELDESNANAMISLRKQEELLKHNEELECQAENVMIDLFAKDVELLTLASQVQQMSDVKADMESKQITCYRVLENLKKEFVSLAIIVDLRENLLLDKEFEVACLLREVDETKMLLHRSKFVAQEKVLLENELEELRRENCMLLRISNERESEVKLSAICVDTLNAENSELKEKVHELDSQVSQLKGELDLRIENLLDLQCSQSCISEQLADKLRDLQQYAVNVNVLQEENFYLKNVLRSLTEKKDGPLCLSTSNSKCFNFIEASGMRFHRIFSVLDEKVKKLSDQMALDTCENMEILSRFMDELESLCCIKEEILFQNLSLSAELLRKDEIVKGLLFDLSLLQESAASTRDQKNEIEDLMASLVSKDEELAVRLHELTEAVAHGKMLEAELDKNVDKVSYLEMNLSDVSQSLKLLTAENMELRSHIDQFAAEKVLTDCELIDKRKVVDRLEMELCEMEQTLNQINNLNESLKSDLNEVMCERVQLHDQLLVMEEKLETALALAEQNDAMATEAQQIAASRSTYAEEKEEEVKLLERSVQELDSTINVLENKVDILKGEAERQRLQREELEMELHSLKDQLQNVDNADADIKRHLDEKEKNIQEALKYIQNLKNDLTNKNVEIAQCRAHISELSLHAEAQACEYKKKFKALEAMAKQVKPESSSGHVRSSSCSKLEKNPTKTRGSGSPFKCIGLGLAHQLKSETDEELSADRLRMEELEALAASRQKEIFILNSRLAAAESMTHDVIRDLLGVKLDMSSCMSLLNSQQALKTAEKSQLDSDGLQAKEVQNLRKQLNEFIEEREGWLEEIDRRQAELIAAQIALENLHQRDRLLTTENEMLKMESAKHKQKEMELEGEVKKLSGQQNIHQRIHHHAKIKEENNQLKVQNDELTARLQQADTILSRVREELAHHGAFGGRSPYIIVFDEEQRLKGKLKECEEGRLQLAQELLGLCTCILKAAGITKPEAEINLSVAEEALEQLVRRGSALERELEDLRLKNKVAGERLRLSELVQQFSVSPSSSRREEDSYQSPRRMSKPPYFDDADR
ncbi:hypothetical protein Dimus_002259 [Dionaea muscipula]